MLQLLQISHDSIPELSQAASYSRVVQVESCFVNRRYRRWRMLKERLDDFTNKPPGSLLVRLGVSLDSFFMCETCSHGTLYAVELGTLTPRMTSQKRTSSLMVVAALPLHLLTINCSCRAVNFHFPYLGPLLANLTFPAFCHLKMVPILTLSISATSFLVLPLAIRLNASSIVV